MGFIYSSYLGEGALKITLSTFNREVINSIQYQLAVDKLGGTITLLTLDSLGKVGFLTQLEISEVFHYPLLYHGFLLCWCAFATLEKLLIVKLPLLGIIYWC